MDPVEFHKKLKGKIKVSAKADLYSSYPLVYTPGVAKVSEYVAREGRAEEVSIKGNSVAIVSNGTRVLGLGNVGPEAALPVMEGKAMLLNVLAGIDAFPLCIKARTKEEIVKVVEAVEPTFGGIILEDIETPLVFEVEKALDLNIPVFHDDQHGTAIGTLAALINALKKVELKEQRIAIVGAGSAGYGIAKLLKEYSKNFSIVVFDSKGALSKQREGLPAYKQELAELNEENYSGPIKGFNIIISASRPGALRKENIEGAKVLFALSNPVPEISKEEAEEAGVAVYGNGKAGKNQINNALCFPGFMRAMLDLRIKKPRPQHMIAAAQAIAHCAEDLMPSIEDRKVVGEIVKRIREA